MDWRPEARRDGLVCVECGTVAVANAAGWHAYRSDLPPDAEAEDAEAAEILPILGFCPVCAAREFELN